MNIRPLSELRDALIPLLEKASWDYPGLQELLAEYLERRNYEGLDPMAKDMVDQYREDTK